MESWSDCETPRTASSKGWKPGCAASSCASPSGCAAAPSRRDISWDGLWVPVMSLLFGGQFLSGKPSKEVTLLPNSTTWPPAPRLGDSASHGFRCRWLHAVQSNEPVADVGDRQEEDDSAGPRRRAVAEP